MKNNIVCGSKSHIPKFIGIFIKFLPIFHEKKITEMSFKEILNSIHISTMIECN